MLSLAAELRERASGGGLDAPFISISGHYVPAKLNELLLRLKDCMVHLGNRILIWFGTLD